MPFWVTKHNQMIERAEEKMNTHHFTLRDSRKSILFFILYILAVHFLIRSIELEYFQGLAESVFLNLITIALVLAGIISAFWQVRVEGDEVELKTILWQGFFL
jgi:hypothetical protein